MQATWRRGDQDQMNVKSTTEMVGPAGKVVILAGRAFITLEDVTAEMVADDMKIGLATAGIWEIPKEGIAFSQFADVFVTSEGKIGTSGTFIGIAENAVGASDVTVMVQFSSLAKAA